MNVADINETDLATLTAQGYTKEDLGMLADTEVKALLAPESNHDEVDPHDRAAEQQDEAAQAAAEAAAAEAAAAEAAAAAAAAAAGAQGNDTAQAAGNDTTPGAVDSESTLDDDTTFVPQFRAEVPADAAAQIAAEKAKDAEAFGKLMDGLIDAAEYQKVKAATEARVDELRTAALQADIFNKANEQFAAQAAEREWKRAEAAQMNAFKAEGLDYRAKPGLLAAFNVHLKALGADTKNERRDAAWFLTEAHKLTKAELGITTAAPAKPNPTPNNTPRGVDPNDIPPTLRGVPAAGNNAVQTDEFAHMRNLSGVAYEKAFAGLTEAQRDRFMAE